jgi:hypothetical protein
MCVRANSKAEEQADNNGKGKGNRDLASSDSFHHVAFRSMADKCYRDITTAAAGLAVHRCCCIHCCSPSWSIDDPLSITTGVIDRRNGATDDRRYGASLKRVKRAISGVKKRAILPVFGGLI